MVDPKDEEPLTPATVWRYRTGATVTVKTLSLNLDKIVRAKDTTDTLILVGQAKNQSST